MDPNLENYPHRHRIGIVTEPYLHRRKQHRGNRHRITPASRHRTSPQPSHIATDYKQASAKIWRFQPSKPLGSNPPSLCPPALLQPPSCLQPKRAPSSPTLQPSAILRPLHSPTPTFPYHNPGEETGVQGRGWQGWRELGAESRQSWEGAG